MFAFPYGVMLGPAPCRADPAYRATNADPGSSSSFGTSGRTDLRKARPCRNRWAPHSAASRRLRVRPRPCRTSFARYRVQFLTWAADIERMDLLSLVGTVLAIAALLVGAVLKGAGLSALWSPAAFTIVILGTIASILLQTPMR